MSYPVRRAMLLLGICFVGGPVQAQDRPVVQAPNLTGDYQRPGMLPGIPTSSGGAAVSSEGGSGGTMIKDVTPPFIPGRSEPVHDEKTPYWAHTQQTEGSWYAFGEVLLMKPRRAATDYGIADGANDLVPRGKMDNVLYDYTGALRISGGYNFANGWSMGLVYTNLRDSNQRALFAPAGGLIYPTLTRPGLIDNVNTAHADIHLEYDVFDIVTQKKVAIDDSFSMLWGGGMKFASIRQELNSLYNGRDANFARVHNINDFYGTGPTFGGETHWNMAGPISFYAKANAGMLVGDLKTGLTETNNRGATVNADLQDKVARVIPVVNVGLGVTYQFKYFQASIGYEVTNYFGLIQRPQFINDFAEGKTGGKSGDFSLDGFNFKLGWNY